MLKLNKLFYKSDVNSDVFGDRIEPAPEARKYLSACIAKVKNHLTPRIRHATKEKLGMERVVEPRFRTQGSWLYDTCVEPSSTPPQEMDWDYGIYLPVTVWQENGPPHEMAKAYFELVEGLLVDLCKQEGWTLLAGKNTCIRIKVAAWAHIDIPLYAAPEEEFGKIRDRIALEEAHLRKTFDSIAADSYDFAEAQQQQWEDLDHIVMATREGEWKASDPEVVAKWFRDRVSEHGEQLRRVCRYLKAWRDFHWQEGGPTSVSIMIAVTQRFQPKPGRDDLALEDAAKRLTNVFLSSIRERGIDDGREDFNRLEPADRATASRRFGQLANDLEDSRLLGVQHKDQAIFQMKQQFGLRMPVDSSLVEADSAADTIRTTTPIRVVPPVVPSTSAG